MFNISRCFFLLILLVIVAFDLKAQSPSANIVFDEKVHNFGTIREKDGKVSHTFVFHNTGKTSVLINDIYSSCGCIGKLYTDKPVAPGQKGKIIVTFDPSYKSGFFSKEMIVYSNNKQDYNRIWVEGNINAAEHPVEDDYPYNFGNGLHLRLKVMAFGYVKPGETKQVELHYANGTSKEMIFNIAVKDNQPGLKFISPGKIGPGAKGVISFSYTMPFTCYDNVVFILYPYVNGQKLPGSIEARILNEVSFNKKKGTE